MMKVRKTLLSLGCALALSTTGAVAQAQDAIDIATWDQSHLYKGWSAENMFNTPVRDIDGDEIGEVENIIVNADGSIRSLIIEAGGFLDIGDTHFDVSWDQITVGPGLEYVTIPIEDDNYDQFNLFGNDDVVTGPRAWRATELMDDYVSLEDVRGYGYVNDLIFNNDGQLQAVIVNPDVGYGTRGYYAYPYYGYDYGYDPGLNTYGLPYNRSQIENLKPFDYDLLEEEGEFAVIE